jgi:hypothetical protein
MFGTLYGPYLILTRFTPGTFDVVCIICLFGAAPGGSATFPPLPTIRHLVSIVQVRI